MIEQYKRVVAGAVAKVRASGYDVKTSDTSLYSYAVQVKTGTEMGKFLDVIAYAEPPQFFAEAPKDLGYVVLKDENGNLYHIMNTGYEKQIKHKDDYVSISAQEEAVISLYSAVRPITNHVETQSHTKSLDLPNRSVEHNTKHHELASELPFYAAWKGFRKGVMESFDRDFKPLGYRLIMEIKKDVD